MNVRELFGIIAIALMIFGCGSVSNPDAAIDQLSERGDFSEAQVDSVASALSKYPNGTQLAIGLVEDSTARFYGSIRNSDTLQIIQNADRVFEIGSISKVFTSALLADMALEGSVQLDDHIQDYLDFVLNDSLAITFKQLSNHTSGMPRVPSGFVWEALWHMDNPYKDYDEQKLRKYLSTYVALESEPGSAYQYSNIGAGTLGYVLTRISGKSYGELLNERLFGRLGMASTTVDRSEVADRLVTGLDKSGDSTTNWDLGALQGAGAILSSARDLSKFAMANFDTTQQALAFQRESTYSINANREVALGWFIEEQENGQRWHLHNGGTGGYRSSIILDTAKQQGVIILANISAGHKYADQIDALGKYLLRTSSASGQVTER